MHNLLKEMIRLIQRASAFLASHSSLYVILTALASFLVPEIFTWIKGDVSSVILGIIMLTMGLTLTVDDFRDLFSRPLDIIIGHFARHSALTPIYP